jgi:hypothetical protein
VAERHIADRNGIDKLQMKGGLPRPARGTLPLFGANNNVQFIDGQFCM